jgi:hypothetical protein
MSFTRGLMVTALVIACGAGRGVAEPTVTASAASAASAPTSSHHAVFVELLGKGGLWGAGYEYRAGRFAVGGVASYYELGGDRFTTLAPYVGVDVVAGARAAWFVHVGPQVVRRATPSPGPEWMGMTSTGLAAEASSGVEVRWTQLRLRGYALLAVGAHVAPGVGLSLGWSL